MIHWFIESLTHRCIDSWFRWAHWFEDLLIHWFIELFIHWFVGSLIQCFISSLLRWCIGSLIHWLIGSSSIHWLIGPNDSLIHSVSRAWPLSCHVISISTTICPFVGALHNFNTCLLLHVKTLPIGNLLSSYSCFKCSKFPSQHGPGTTWSLPGICMYTYQVTTWLHVYIYIYTYMLVWVCDSICAILARANLVKDFLGLKPLQKRWFWFRTAPQLNLLWKANNRML